MPQMMMNCSPMMKGGVKKCRSRGGGGHSKRSIGSSNAARVSRGSNYGEYKGLTQTTPKRNDGEHITVTVVFYNTISGGVPSKEDVMAAIDDMEALYEACTDSGNLADKTFDFMKSELTVKDCMDITEKVVRQPYKSPPKPPAVENFDVFPTD